MMARSVRGVAGEDSQWLHEIAYSSPGSGDEFTPKYAKPPSYSSPSKDGKGNSRRRQDIN